MREKVPRITAGRIISLLQKRGYVCVCQSGSHKIFRNNTGIRVTVPDPSGKILHPKIVKQICRDTGINPQELG